MVWVGLSWVLVEEKKQGQNRDSLEKGELLWVLWGFGARGVKLSIEKI